MPKLFINVFAVKGVSPHNVETLTNINAILT